MTTTTAPLDVWLRFDSPDDEEASAEANVYADGNAFRADWYLTAVGLVKSRSFDTYADARSWLTAEGFSDYSS